MAAKANKIKPGLHSTLDTATPYNQWSTSGIVKKDKEFLKCLAKKHSEFKTSKITKAAEIQMQLYTYNMSRDIRVIMSQQLELKRNSLKRNPWLRKLKVEKHSFQAQKRIHPLCSGNTSSPLHHHDNATRPSTPANIVHIDKFFSTTKGVIQVSKLKEYKTDQTSLLSMWKCKKVWPPES